MLQLKENKHQAKSICHNLATLKLKFLFMANL